MMLMRCWLRGYVAGCCWQKQAVATAKPFVFTGLKGYLLLALLDFQILLPLPPSLSRFLNTISNYINLNVF
jgi:hypothetical protein